MDDTKGIRGLLAAVVIQATKPIGDFIGAVLRGLAIGP